MEVDPTEATVATVPINVWCFLGKEGTKKVKADLALKELTLNSLKEFMCRIVGVTSPNEIDVLYNGGILKNDESVKSAQFRPMNVITVIKTSQEPCTESTSASSNVNSQITQVALALRTAFLNPKFIPMVMRLGQTEMLENIMAIAPGLKNDPIGIAMIQDPTVIFHLSDFESLKKLANSRPWVVEAFNFMAASVHQEKGQGSKRSDVTNALLNASLLADDDEDMDDGADDEGGLNNSNRITREQLSAALNSLSALGRGPLGTTTSAAQSTGTTSSRSATGSALFDLFSQASGTRTAPASGSIPTPSPNNPADLSRMLSAGIGAGVSTTNTPVLTPEMVARAMRTALNSLPPDAREARFNELRDQIARIQGGGSGASAANLNPTLPTQPPVNPTPVVAARNSQYAQQLNQMRDMGINDERLSVLALQVSDGDVETAVELIFSGWTGEGADVEMPDEE